jgi:hypothetical protein
VTAALVPSTSAHVPGPSTPVPAALAVAEGALALQALDVGAVALVVAEGGLALASCTSVLTISVSTSRRAHTHCAPLHLVSVLACLCANAVPVLTCSMSACAKPLQMYLLLVLPC